MTGPVWDGRGTDPWLPQRLNAALDAAEHERAIRAQYWSLLRDWLRRLSARVLRAGSAPDPDAVFAMAPAWVGAVDDLLDGSVRRALAVAYDRLFGPGFAWEQRPFVRAYVDTARNRLTRVPEETYDLIRREVREGVDTGDSIPQLAARIEQTFSGTATPYWPNRATVVARTEAIGALNGGRQDAYAALAEQTGAPLEKIWLATEDSRTRETHRDADGQRVPIGQPFEVGGFELQFPGDPSGPPQEVIQCRCTQLLVAPGESVDMSNRGYRG